MPACTRQPEGEPHSVLPLYLLILHIPLIAKLSKTTAVGFPTAVYFVRMIPSTDAGPLRVTRDPENLTFYKGTTWSYKVPSQSYYSAGNFLERQVSLAHGKEEPFPGQ